MHCREVLIVSICALTCVAGAGMTRADDDKKADDEKKAEEGKQKVTLCHRPLATRRTPTRSPSARRRRPLI